MIVQVEEREYARLLGYPWGTLLEGDVRGRAQEAADWYAHHGNPRVYCVDVKGEGSSEVPGNRKGETKGETSREKRIPLLGKGGVAAPIKKMLRSYRSGRRRGGSFKELSWSLNQPPRPRPLKVPSGYFLDGASSPPLPRRGISASPLHVVEQFTVVAITAGAEVDLRVQTLWETGVVDEAYFLDRYAAGVVEKLAAEIGAHKSPGTGDVPFEYQWTLFSYIAPLKPEIDLLPSGMLRPKNSLLAFVSCDARPTSNPCHRCDLAGCTFRRTTL